MGGDLFHDNKPSHNTLQRTLQLLTKYVLSDRPVAFQVVSDQRQNFVSGRVNYESSNVNVGLPIFTIHGNHDDPSGANSLSAVDLLSTTSLVNYFGKISFLGSGVGKIQLAPVLLTKGETHLALYGLGNLRDERLARMFQTPGAVEWVRPAEAPQLPQDSWFNVFVLHQNRLQHSSSTKNTIREAYLARFLDLVVWGHEHECILDTWDTTEGEGAFSVLQPGSSVATALSEGESRSKHVQVLEVVGSDFRLVKHRLTTVRPFVFQKIMLADEVGVDSENEETLSAFLEQRVDQACQLAQRQHASPSTAAPLPLVRLRVDYTGFSTINVQRFGQKFVGKVANPHDVLLWHKAPARAARPGSAGGAAGPPLDDSSATERGVEALITDYLAANLEVLAENDMAEALHRFVEKDDKGAMADVLQRSLQLTQVALQADTAAAAAADCGGDVETFILEAARQRRDASEASLHLPGGNMDSGAAPRLPPPTPEGISPMEVDGTAPPDRPCSAAGGDGSKHTLAAAFARGRAAGSRATESPTPSQATRRPPLRNGTAAASTQPSRLQRLTPHRGASRARMESASMDSQDEISDAVDELDDVIEDPDEVLGDDVIVPSLAPSRARATAASRAPGRRKKTALGGSTHGGSTPGIVGSFIVSSDEEETTPVPRRVAGVRQRQLPASLGRPTQRGRSQR